MQVRGIMYKHCTSEAGALRQRNLEQCLLELMTERPLEQITVGDISARAGISRKSFYRYFDSKDSCLHALLDRAIMNGPTYCIPESGSRSPSLDTCCRVFEYWQTQRPLLDAMFRNGQGEQILQRAVRCILEEEPEYARIMGVRAEDVLEEIVFTVSGGIGLIFTWHQTNYQKTPGQMGAILYRLMHR